MHGYLIQYFNKYGNGYAIVGAPSPKEAEQILESQGKLSNEYTITSIKLLQGCYPINTVVQEGIINNALSAYDIAVKNGFQGSEAEWYQSLSQPARDAATRAEKALQELAIATSDIMNAEKVVQDAVQTFTVDCQPQRLTWKQFKSIKEKKMKIYLTTDTKNNVQRFYIGDTLIAQIADDGSHVIGFPYILPAIV